MTLPGSASLNGIVFHGWRGWVGSLNNVIDIFARIGEAGSGSQIVQTRAAPVQISAWIAAANDSDAVNHASDVEALSGTIAELEDPWGRDLAHVRVTEVRCSIHFGHGTEISGGIPMTHIVRCEFTVELLP